MDVIEQLRRSPYTWLVVAGINAIGLAAQAWAHNAVWTAAYSVSAFASLMATRDAIAGERRRR